MDGQTDHRQLFCKGQDDGDRENSNKKAFPKREIRRIAHFAQLVAKNASTYIIHKNDSYACDATRIRVTP